MYLARKTIATRIISAFVVLLLLLPLCFAVNASGVPTSSGTTYYISDSLGNDENNGTSESTPWKSIERLSQVNLTAGDKVLFRSGDIWYGAFELDVSGGEPENPITFSSYGEGAKPSLRLYTGSVPMVTEGICLRLWNANGFVMDGLDIGYANLGIKLCYDVDHYESDYVCFKNCHFHDIYGVTQLDYLSEIYFSAGIAVSVEGSDWKNGDAEGNGWALRGLYIDQCTAYDAGSLVASTGGVYGFYMTDCVTEENGYYGTGAFGCRNGYIDRCVFKNSGSRDIPAGSCGIMISATDFTIKNTIIMGQQRQGSNPDGCGIDFEWDCHNVVVENCLFQENAGVGIMYFTSGQGENGTNYDTHIRNCYFVNNNTNIGNVGGYDIYATAYASSNCEITGNKYICTDMKYAETIDFVLALENNDLLLENNVELDAIPENLEAMILNPEQVPQDKNQDEDSNIILYCIIAAIAAIILSTVIWAFIALCKKKSVSK